MKFTPPDYTTEYLNRLKDAGIIAPDATTANITINDDEVIISWTKPKNVVDFKPEDECVCAETSTRNPWRTTECDEDCLAVIHHTTACRHPDNDWAREATERANEDEA